MPKPLRRRSWFKQVAINFRREGWNGFFTRTLLAIIFVAVYFGLLSGNVNQLLLGIIIFALISFSGGLKAKLIHVMTLVGAILVLFQLFSVHSRPGVEAEKSHVLFEAVRSGVVKIGEISKERPNRLSKVAGTGFQIENNCTFVTAKHVINQLNRDFLAVGIVLPPGKGHLGHAAKVIREDPQRDIVFLRVESVGKNPCRSGNLHSFNFYSDSPDRLIGQDILVIGYPALAKTKSLDIPILRRGTVASTEINSEFGIMLLLDLIGVPGFSGSPVILERTREVVGIIYGPGQIDRGYGFEWATPMRKHDNRIWQASTSK